MRCRRTYQRADVASGIDPAHQGLHDMHLEAGGNQGSFGMASNSKFDIKSGLPLPLDDMRDVALGAAAPEPRCDVQDPSHAAIAAGDRWSRR